jgi:hypothetical protein
MDALREAPFQVCRLVTFLRGHSMSLIRPATFRFQTSHDANAHKARDSAGGGFTTGPAATVVTRQRARGEWATRQDPGAVKTRDADGRAGLECPDARDGRDGKWIVSK